MRVGAAAAARRVGVAAVGGLGKRVAVWLLEGVGERGIQWHVGLILSQVSELSQKAVLRVVLAVPRNQHRWENGALHSLIVVGIDADFLLLGTKWELAAFQRL